MKSSLRPLLACALAMAASCGDDGKTELPDVFVEPGYTLVRAVDGLDFPTAMGFTGHRVLVAEAGLTADRPPRVKAVDLQGGVEVVLEAAQLSEGMLAGPLTDVTASAGWVWLTHRQVGVNGWLVGAISRFRLEDPIGTFRTVVTNLPSAGDHLTDEIVFGPDDRAYFGQGTATNTGVVGPDNDRVTKWLAQAPDFHDFPAKDILLATQGFITDDPRTPARRPVVTAAFMPFATGGALDETLVRGPEPGGTGDRIVAGNGAIYSFDPSVSDPTATLRLEAWGLRNPSGMGFDPMDPGTLLVTNNGADHRGIIENNAFRIVEPRPIGNDWDDLFEVSIGGSEEFFGWPDFFHASSTGEPLPVTDDRVCQPTHLDLRLSCGFVLATSFRGSLVVSPALAQLQLHSSANKLDIATEAFGFAGQVFAAETGSLPPTTGAGQYVGYKVVRVDRATGEVTDFVANRAQNPERLFDPALLNKPIDVKFNQDRLFIVDLGVFEPGLGLAQAGTGKIWIIAKSR